MEAGIYTCIHTYIHMTAVARQKKLWSSTVAIMAKENEELRQKEEEEDPDAVAYLYPAWRVGVAYAVGDFIQHGGMMWKVIQAHTSQVDWPPPIVPALFNRVLAAGDVEWAYPVAYAVGAEVTYLGLRYRCLQAHTSQAGWTPVAVPALWTRI